MGVNYFLSLINYKAINNKSEKQQQENADEKIEGKTFSRLTI
jgi:hypothetical protein